jgi:hypothetical protein
MEKSLEEKETLSQDGIIGTSDVELEDTFVWLMSTITSIACPEIKYNFKLMRCGRLRKPGSTPSSTIFTPAEVFPDKGTIYYNMEEEEMIVQVLCKQLEYTSSACCFLKLFFNSN